MVVTLQRFLGKLFQPAKAFATGIPWAAAQTTDSAAEYLLIMRREPRFN